MTLGIRFAKELTGTYVMFTENGQLEGETMYPFTKFVAVMPLTQTNEYLPLTDHIALEVTNSSPLDTPIWLPYYINLENESVVAVSPESGEEKVIFDKTNYDYATIRDAALNDTFERLGILAEDNDGKGLLFVYDFQRQEFLPFESATSDTMQYIPADSFRFENIRGLIVNTTGNNDESTSQRWRFTVLKNAFIDRYPV